MILTLTVSALAVAVGCGPEPQQKTPLVVCTAGENGCPKEKPEVGPKPAKSGGEDPPAGPTGDPTPAPATQPAKKTTDPAKEPVSEPKDVDTKKTDPDPRDDSPAMAPSCVTLSFCCDAIRAMGITGSADQCDRTVTDNNNFSCDLLFKENGKPDEAYDPPVECM